MAFRWMTPVWPVKGFGTVKKVIIADEPWATLSVAKRELVDEPRGAVEAMHAIGGHGHAENCTRVGGEGSNELLGLSQNFNRREQV
jgi:hypothetical protein